MQTHFEIRTKDGKKICLNCYTPETATGKVMIVAPTGGLTQEHYMPFAYFFREWGFTVITFDYRGMGCSAPEHLKGFEANMHQWAVQDIDAVLLYVKNKYPQQEIIFTGHCIGGEIIGLAQASQYIGKLVLVNSALSCRNLWPLKDRFRITGLKAMVWMLNKLFGYFPGRKLGYLSDIPKGVMYEWADWCSHPNGLFGSFPDNNYRKLQVPLIAFSFTDDWHCPPRAVQELLNRFTSALITWHHIRPVEIGVKKIGHCGFFDTRMKTILWMKLLEWIRQDERRK